ncbi:MAG: response regulator [Clostridiales bacterium]|nr:response regulator [Clostridiales bacterium]
MSIFTYVSENIVLVTILFFVSLLTALLFLLCINQNRKLKKLQILSNGEKSFYNAFTLNNLNCYMLIRKEDLRVLYISPNFKEMTGFDEDVIYDDVETLKEALNKKSVRRVIKNLKEWDKVSSLRMEFNYKVCDSEQYKRGKVVLNYDEKNDCYLAVLYDITEEHDTIKGLEAKLAKAYQESQAKTDFLSKMSHEIRTPMNGILGMLNLAKRHLKNPKTTGEYLEKAESLSQFLLTLINDILDMSRIESGKMELEEVSFDLFGVADKLNSMFKSTIEGKGINWVIEMQDFDVRYVIGDELRLTQVIINFISNAHKFTPAGGTVSVTFRQMSKIEGKLHLMIRVRDTGKGIKANFLKNIFKPFEQEEASTARNYGGSGLGMAIADNIIKLMDGQIIVESELGKGSEFIVYISIPIAEGEQKLPEISINESQSNDMDKKEYSEAIKQFKLEGLHLLLAEDNDINAEIAIEVLGMEKAIIDRACDGEEALKMFSESDIGTYDVILMDIQMPNMNGHEATAAIRKLDRADSDVLIFAMSADAFVEDKRQSLAVGMNGHISKPVDFDEVRRTIGEHMYSRDGGKKV